MKSILVTVLLYLSIAIIATSTLQVEDPRIPIWPPYFQQQFTQQYTGVDKFITLGRYWYDSQRQASRVDRGNGVHDAICGSVLPNVSTHCVQLTRDRTRYVYYPQRRLCCICCDAEHGCGFLKRDWLKDSKYQGKQSLSGQTFDKWSIPDGDSMDYYWATQDQQQIPRKMSEVGSRIKDFLMNTYQETKAIDLIFQIPIFCDKTKWCPSSTNCGKFRQQKLKQ